MQSPANQVRDTAQAWHIAVLTAIVLMVGCSKPKSDLNLPQPNSAAAPQRDAAHREVDQLQLNVDEFAAQLSRNEMQLAGVKAKLDKSNAKEGADKKIDDVLVRAVTTLEESVADQKVRLEKMRAELTKRTLGLQQIQKEANAIHNDRDGK